MKVNLIVAVTENNVIGQDNDLPWHLPNDMIFFKNKTNGHCVIMGRKNYLSIPEKFRPLPNRTNLILTNNSSFKAEGCEIFNSLEKAIEYCNLINEKKPFIIGGGQVYKYAIEKKLVDVIYLTRIHTKIEGDTFFPTINLNKWRISYEKFNPKDSKHKFDYTFYKLEKN